MNLITRYLPICRTIRERTRESRLHDDTNNSIAQASLAHEITSASVYHRERLFSYCVVKSSYCTMLAATNERYTSYRDWDNCFVFVPTSLRVHSGNVLAAMNTARHSCRSVNINLRMTRKVKLASD